MNRLSFWPEWTIEEKIGQGAYGTVYRIRKSGAGSGGTDIHSAMKVLRIPSDSSEISNLRSQGMDTRSIRKFLESDVKALENEIRVMISLASAAGIVSIEDYHIEEMRDRIGWEVFIRMELLESLTSYVDRKHVFTLEEALKMGCDLCDALSACESQNIIHRDIKPANIFRNKFGQYKLGDFGVAKQVEGTYSAATRVGTPSYEAPEIFYGWKYDHTVDIYGLGIVLYTYLNQGRKPFYPPYPEPLTRENMQEAMGKRLSGQPVPPIPGMDPELYAIIERACAYQPERRYRNAAELKEDLETYRYRRSGTGTGSGHSAAGTKSDPYTDREAAVPQKIKKRQRILLIGAGIAAMAVVVAAGFVIKRFWSEKRSENTGNGPVISGPAGLGSDTTETTGQGSGTRDLTTILSIFNSEDPSEGKTQEPSEDTSHANEKGDAYFFGEGVPQDYGKAVEWYRKAAEAGDSEGMWNLGYMYDEGLGVSQSYVTAAEWYQKSAEAGNLQGMFSMGCVYYFGEGAPQDYTKAAAWFEKAAEAGDGQAMNNLGAMYEYGEGVVQNYEEAVQWYEKAAEAGDPGGMCSLGLMYEMGRGVTQNKSTAVEWYKKAAESGSARGMCNLAFMYEQGLGTTQDYDKAVEWYEKAAEAGSGRAMNNLGLLYELGEGVSQDYQKAAEWYEKAVQTGDADSMCNLGYLYESGQGVTQDKSTAVEWYRKAADIGSARGMCNLAYMYDMGLGVAQDYDQAVEWYEKAAEAGSGRAMHNLGVMYENGEGVPQDQKKAEEWYQKAKDAGYE